MRKYIVALLLVWLCDGSSRTESTKICIIHAVNFQYQDERMELGFLTDVIKEVGELHTKRLVSNVTHETLINEAQALSYNICEPGANRLE